AIVWKSDFGDKLKSGVHFRLCPVEHIVCLIPGKKVSCAAKRIASVAIEGMPVRTGKFQVVFHWFPEDVLIAIVPSEARGLVESGPSYLICPMPVKNSLSPVMIAMFFSVIND